jgi:integrase
MAIEKVGIYRKYHGAIPTDPSGRALPATEWLRKRPFSWAVRWFGLEGKRYSKSFSSRKEAERFAEQKQSEVRKGKADPPARILLREYYREHKALMSGSLAPKTLHMHLAALALFAKDVGWDRELRRISVRDVERFKAQRLQSGLSGASVNREIKTLKRLFNLAILRGRLPAEANPCSRIPLIKIGRKQPPYCSPEDFGSLFQVAPDSLWRALLAVLYTTGLRLREAMNLTWSDIDFAAGHLHVTRKSASGFVRAWTPKNHERRTLPLSQQAIQLLATWQSIAPEKCPYVFMEPARWEYFQQQVAGGQWKAGQDLVNNVLRRFKTLCGQAKVGPYTIHDLRRSCISNWARQVPIHAVQQLAGHSDIKTTQQFYLSVHAEDVKAAEALQAKLLEQIPEANLTDPKMTHSRQKRAFRGRKTYEHLTEVL